MKRIILILIILIGLFLFFKRNWKNEDVKVGILTPKGISILSISPGREMVNILNLKSNVMVWVPGGMGWYQSDKIKKICENEKDEKLTKDIFYYNFGFFPDKVAVFENADEWRSLSSIKYLGAVNWLRYKIFEGEWLFKEENINSDLKNNLEKFEEILPRDFADSKLLNGEIKMSVYNASNEDGLGSFVADRLNWMGFNVVEVENSSQRNDCILMSKDTKNQLTKSYVELLSSLFNCSQTSNNSLLDGEVILYLGQNYASMLKYNNY